MPNIWLNSLRAFKPRSGEAGFTVANILASITIISVMLSMAIQEYAAMNEVFDREHARTLFYHDVRRAQAETITQGCRGVFTIDADAAGYSFGCDYLEYDTNDPPMADATIFQRELPQGVTIAFDNTLIFSSRGKIVDINDNLDTRTITLSEDGGAFTTGTILGTGMLTYD